jgi:ABC-2 type transport system ATP-binding protein
MLHLDNVVKSYGNFLAVNKVSFDVPKQSIFGLLGPNGAGKTSLIRIITTITRADAGQVFFNGELLNSQHPELIGYMPEERGLYKKMKVGEHLLYLAQLKGLSFASAKKEIRHWLEKFAIEDWWTKKVDELSKGMQQKIQFIATVVHKPALIILDEPFSGLDPINTNLIKEEIRNLNSQGTTIIFSTHRMEQVEEICQEIVLINQGQNVLQGSVAGIKERFKENLFEIEYTGELPAGFLDTVEAVRHADHTLTLKLTDSAQSNEVLGRLLQQGVRIRSFNEILPSVNEIFIRQVEGGGS